MRSFLAAAAILAAGPLSAQSMRAAEGRPAYDVGIPEPSQPTVFFANIKDGATVTSPVALEFGSLAIMIGAIGDFEDYFSGHHHLLIDVTADDLDLTQPIPATENIIHFGGGERRAVLGLLPGTYTLQLLAGDDNHVPHDPPVMSAPITITVVE
ncbi:MAG: DUF4399 domain-containing protein [Rhodobacteraceae bacterium]|nr:MAG: DUF4399 domain-containing protein [Paracoccaceae bacterium]